MTSAKKSLYFGLCLIGALIVTYVSVQIMAENAMNRVTPNATLHIAAFFVALGFVAAGIYIKYIRK